MVVPIDKRLDAGKVPRPDGSLPAVVTGEEFILRTVIHILNTGFYTGQIDLISRNPTEVGGPGARVRIGGAVAHQVSIAVGGILHVFPEVDNVRGSHFYFPARRSGLAEQGISRGVWRIVPRLSVVQRVAKPHEWPQDIPVQTLYGIVVGVQQAIGSVVPNAIVDEAATRVPS